MTPEQRQKVNETTNEWHKKNRKRLRELGFIQVRTWVHKDDRDRYDDLVDTLERKPPPMSKKGGIPKLPGT